MIEISLATLALACKGNPLTLCLVVFCMWLGFIDIERALETLIFGETFQHWLDPIFTTCFMLYAAGGIFYCAKINS